MDDPCSCLFLRIKTSSNDSLCIRVIDELILKKFNIFTAIPAHLDIQVKGSFYEGYERSSVRVSYGRNSSCALEITDANDYYPLGMNYLKTGNAHFDKGGYKRYKYNGKEISK